MSRPEYTEREDAHRTQYKTCNVRAPQSKVVPLESNQVDSIRVYTTSEIEPAWIDLKLRPSVNGLQQDKVD